MRRPGYRIAAIFCLLILLTTTPVLAEGLLAGIDLGRSVGLGGRLAGTFENFTRDLPLSARFSVGYHAGDAGDPLAARRVFINNNTNGTPEESAHSWQFRFDLVLPLTEIGPQTVFLFGGPRHARYTANYNYVGGNENFDVKTNPWGFGVGLESFFAVGARSDFVLRLGLDRYAASELSGHDTRYAPDGIDVNPREDYDYDSADDAVDQPKLEWLAAVGLRFRL